ncbi:MAG: MinD superfamily P-loop ATPase [Candidatus Alkanophagales archaeon MCA70_species_1]|nr:MinD superfamily P-loop ATPase [Candidatus Alkanophaga volatiphilum]
MSIRQLAVVSGKGGTGKTSIVAVFAALAERKVLADCDVDAPDLHLILKPEVLRREEFRGAKVAVVDGEKCTACGRCEEFCRFDAIEKGEVDEILCEGCGVCVVVCPEKAITLQEKVSGYVFLSRTKYGFLSHAVLNAAEENSGKLVTVVRQNALSVAEREACRLILIDGPPGIGCPVISTLSGVDAALIVTEPTVSGLHDLERVLRLARHFNVRPFVCINRYDLNAEMAVEMERFCEAEGVEVVGRVPYDVAVMRALAMGKPVVECSPRSPAAIEMKRVWECLEATLRV